jgi:hypothetical protein
VLIGKREKQNLPYFLGLCAPQQPLLSFSFSNFLHPVLSLYDLNDEEQVEDVETIANIMEKDNSHLFKMAKMMNGPVEGNNGPPPSMLLAQTMRGHHILYPIATHHMLEDLDTMWNLWYTHKLPLKWWLEDRSEDICHDLMDRGPSKNSKIW